MMQAERRFIPFFAEARRWSERSACGEVYVCSVIASIRRGTGRLKDDGAPPFFPAIGRRFLTFERVAAPEKIVTPIAAGAVASRSLTRPAPRRATSSPFHSSGGDDDVLRTYPRASGRAFGEHQREGNPLDPTRTERSADADGAHRGRLGRGCGSVLRHACASGSDADQATLSLIAGHYAVRGAFSDAQRDHLTVALMSAFPGIMTIGQPPVRGARRWRGEYIRSIVSSIRRGTGRLKDDGASPFFSAFGCRFVTFDLVTAPEKIAIPIAAGAVATRSVTRPIPHRAIVSAHHDGGNDDLQDSDRTAGREAACRVSGGEEQPQKEAHLRRILAVRTHVGRPRMESGTQGARRLNGRGGGVSRRRFLFPGRSLGDEAEWRAGVFEVRDDREASTQDKRRVGRRHCDGCISGISLSDTGVTRRTVFCSYPVFSPFRCRTAGRAVFP